MAPGLINQIAGEAIGGVIAPTILRAVGASSDQQPANMPLQSPGGKGFTTSAATQQQIKERVRAENYRRRLINATLAKTGLSEELPLLDEDQEIKEALANLRTEAEGITDREIRKFQATELPLARLVAEREIERQRLASQANVIQAEEQRKGTESKAFLEGFLENVIDRPKLENSAVAVELARGV